MNVITIEAYRFEIRKGKMKNKFKRKTPNRMKKKDEINRMPMSGETMRVMGGTKEC